MTIHIRPALIQDLPLILSFIQALAEYEKLRDQCVATIEDLKQTLFCDQPFAQVVIAEYEGQAVGFALYFYNYSTFLAKPGIYLEDLFVLEDFRGKGVGFALLQYLAKIAVDKGCGRFEWSVLDWNTPAISFYRKIGAVGMDDWTVQRLEGEGILRLAERISSQLNMGIK
jgi:GNAT superfamily N-acetyltransferase